MQLSGKLKLYIGQDVYFGEGTWRNGRPPDKHILKVGNCDYDTPNARLLDVGTDYITIQPLAGSGTIFSSSTPSTVYLTEIGHIKGLL